MSYVFRAPELCQAVGISMRQQDYWARVGLLEPSVSVARGSGTQRRYSYHDALRALTIKWFRDAGFGLRSAAEAASLVAAIRPEDLDGSIILVTSQGSRIVRSAPEIIDAIRGADGIQSLLPMSAMVSRLDNWVAEHRPFRPHPAPTPSTPQES